MAPAWVALDQGHFRQARPRRHARPDPEPVAQPPRYRRPAIRIAASTPTDLIKAVAGGLDVVASAGEAIEVKSNPTTQVIVRKDSGIKSAADLKGKAIGAPTLGAVTMWRPCLAEEERRRSRFDPRRRSPVPQHGRPAQAGNVDAVKREPFAGALLEPATCRSAISPPPRRGAVPVLDFRRQRARANRPIIRRGSTRSPMRKRT
jgi:hypothetical protein